jgi:hypothetical protein
MSWINDLPLAVGISAGAAILAAAMYGYLVPQRNSLARKL